MVIGQKLQDLPHWIISIPVEIEALLRFLESGN
jgi:hypothetical protein